MNEQSYNFSKQILMSDNEEGFAVQQATQLIQFNYKPCSRAWTTIAKKCNPNYKKYSNQLTLITCSSRFINDSIHSQWVDSLFSSNKPKNIVFNATTKASHNFQENNIRFQSDFQSGNMEIISRVKNNQYEMYMKPDSNTKCHFQWFYFKAFIKKGNRVVKFSIKNFIKATMLYSKGLKPYCRSLKNPEYHQFRQIESPVKFYQDQNTNYYSLQFSYNFQYDNDEVQFSSQPPYPLAHLSKFIQPLKCKKLTLGKTVMGNKIPYLIYQAKKQVKVVAIIIARQHPGQSVSSWMMEGFINQLNQHKLNDYISWYVIPIVNIDGVIIGNNRTGILGHDFNRNWVIQETTNSKYNKLFPETQSIISLVKNLKRKFPRKVKMFLDLHGHSSQQNVFSYGPPHQYQSQYFYQCRLFPQLISRKNSNFKLNQCSYVLHPEKKKTARSVIFYNMGIPFTYTIQSTFGIMNDRNIGTDDFLKIGEDIALSAYQFIHTSIIKENPHNFNSIIQDIKQKYQTAKYEGEQFDSASQASDDNPNRQKIQEMVILGQEQVEKHQLQLPLPKENKRYEDLKAEISCQFQERHKSLKKTRQAGQKQLRNFSSKKSQKKRVNTQGQLLINKKQCIFPNIATRNSKLSFQQTNFMSAQEMMHNLKMDEIQKRLQRLRYSKIGKKILVINAYCS